METVAVVVVGVVVVGLLVRRIQRVQDDLLGLARRLNAVLPGESHLFLRGDEGETTIGPGRLTLETPHGHRGPQLTIRAVPGTPRRYLWQHLDGSEREYEVADGAGFDIAYTPPTLPEEPLPPHVRLEFRDDTLTARTWRAKIATTEWQIGDGY